MFAASGKGKLLGFSKVFQEEENEDAPQLMRNGENGLSQDADENKYRKESRKLSTWMGLVVLGWLLSLFVLVVVMDRRLPTALTIADLPVHPDSFIEERARHQLRSLTSIGARPTGSYENEVLAVQLLQRELAGIKERAHPIHKITVELQKPRGSFNLKFVDGLTHSYRCSSELANKERISLKIELVGTSKMLWQSWRAKEGRSMPCSSTAISTRSLKAQVKLVCKAYLKEEPSKCFESNAIFRFWLNVQWEQYVQQLSSN